MVVAVVMVVVSVTRMESKVKLAKVVWVEVISHVVLRMSLVLTEY